MYTTTVLGQSNTSCSVREMSNFIESCEDAVNSVTVCKTWSIM